MKKNSLQPNYNPESKLFEIGIDEAGRGPMFGRVYSGAVVLPKNDDFKYELLKDSKKFTSEKKINEVADYIKQNAISWCVSYEDEKIVDSINIRNARHAKDPRPLDPKCGCPTCKNYSRAYLHHVCKVGEIISAILLTWHNLHYYQELMSGIRSAIFDSKLSDFAEQFVSMQKKGDIPPL